MQKIIKSINSIASNPTIAINKEENIMQNTTKNPSATRTTPVVNIADLAKTDYRRKGRTTKAEAAARATATHAVNLTDLSRTANIAARRLGKTIFNPLDAAHPLTRLRLERIAKYGPIIVRMRNCGLTFAQIAAYIGLNKLTVTKYLQEYITNR